MYFLRRRHGRKPQSEARRDAAPVGPNSGPSARFDSAVNARHNSANESGALPESQSPYPEAEEPPRPVVIKKAKRQRVAAPLPDDDCKPAGTFRAGTLHIAHASRSQPQQGKF